MEPLTASLERAQLRSVSYTHLDVYKRQALGPESARPNYSILRNRELVLNREILQPN